MLCWSYVVQEFVHPSYNDYEHEHDEYNDGGGGDSKCVDLTASTVDP